MYWFRDGNPTGIIPWGAAAILWILGGWLIATHAFQAKKKERVILGFGLGLVVYLWLVNLLGKWLEPTASFFIPAVLVFLIGLLYAWKSDLTIFDIKDLSGIYPLLIVFLFLFVYSVFMERGLAIFDDYHHLPAISVIGAGSLPPMYYLNANYDYSYHYGFQLLGASMMRLGDLFAWSAYDISKALVWAFSVILVVVLIGRYLKKPWQVLFGVVAFLLMGGTRYILMLLPHNWLQILDRSIGFIGISANMNLPLSEALFTPWSASGGPPIPYIFGFLNGINTPYIMSHVGEWPLALIIILLLWLLSEMVTSVKVIPVLVMLMAHLSLTYESSYGLLMVAVVLLFIYLFFTKKLHRHPGFHKFLIAAGISVPFSILQGGTLFSIAQSMLQKTTGPAIIIHSASASVFSLQLPPTFFSAHFGGLNIFSPSQLLVGLLEIGPILFFTPWLTRWVIQRFKDGEWMIALLMLSAWVGFFLSLIVTYNLSERDITRFSKHAILIWSFILIFCIFTSRDVFGVWGKRFAIMSLMVMSVGGVVNGYTQMSALNSPVLSEGLDVLDSAVSSQAWGKISQDELIFDTSSNSWRASALTGALTVAGVNRDPIPIWIELSRNPSVQGFVQNGYRYVYYDQIWWRSLTDRQKFSMSNECILTIVDVSQDNYFLFRKLIDLDNCHLVE